MIDNNLYKFGVTKCFAFGLKEVNIDLIFLSEKNKTKELIDSEKCRQADDSHFDASCHDSIPCQEQNILFSASTNI